MNRGALAALRPATLRGKLGAIGGALLVLALASIALTLSLSWKLEGSAAAVNEAGRMRMLTWRLAQGLADADPALTAQRVRELDMTLELLRSGDPSRPLVVPQDQRSAAAFANVRTRWHMLRGQWLSVAPAAPKSVRQDADAMVGEIDAFVSAIEGRIARWTAWLSAFQLAMMALALATAVAMLYAAYLFVFNPLARLQQGLASVEAGALSTRVPVHSGDELGALAAGFNRMAQTLQGLYETLEAKVAAKTASLAAQQQRLSALYEAASLVAGGGSMEALAGAFARQLRLLAGADAAAVRWSDESNGRYLLLASDCLPSQMIEDERCMRTGACHCGQPQAQAATRVFVIHNDAAHSRTGCAQHGFESVLSVPVRLQDRVLGEVDLFFRHCATVSDDDRNLLDTLASHLAGAIEGHRMGALEREAALAEERGLLARELHDSIAQSLVFLQIQLQVLRQATAKGNAAQAQAALAELDAGVRESTGDVRELLLHFRTRTNAEDITPALQSTLQKFEHQSGLKAHFSMQGSGMPLAPDVQVQVLHVVQEALSNVRKHASANAVWLEVQQAPQWRFEVRDDGLGFVDQLRPDDTHVGLRIMRERAAGIGAEVLVDTVPGAGTSVVLTLPRGVAA